MIMDHCVDPTQIQPGDLLALAAGEDRPRARAHLRDCPYCAAQFRACAQLDAWLEAEQYRATCPPTDTLVRWQARLLPAAAELAVAAHVRSCPHCAGEMLELTAPDAELRSFLRDLPQVVLRWVEAAFVTLAPQPVGIRGVPLPQQRYTVAGMDLFIHAQEVPGGRELVGRLHLPGPVAPGIQVWLVQDGLPVQSTSTDDLGHFGFSPVPPGSYDLVLAWSEEGLLVRAVEV
jgi:hypothetical protein